MRKSKTPAYGIKSADQSQLVEEKIALLSRKTNAAAKAAKARQASNKIIEALTVGIKNAGTRFSAFMSSVFDLIAVSAFIDIRFILFKLNAVRLQLSAG
jgi:hypothetical protein